MASVATAVSMSRRLPTYLAEIVVPSPLPRGEDFRLCAEYAEKCRATSLALHEAMAMEGTGDAYGQGGAK